MTHTPFPPFHSYVNTHIIVIICNILVISMQQQHPSQKRTIIVTIIKYKYIYIESGLKEYKFYYFIYF